MGGGPAKDHLLALLPFPEPKEIFSALQKKFPSLDITYHQTGSNKNAQELYDSVPKHLWHSATILVTLFTFPQDLSEIPNLELVHLVSAGSNQLQGQPLYKDSDVTITTSTGIHGPQIAEWVVMTGLVGSHHYKQLYELQKAHQWGGDGKTDYRAVRDKVGQRIGVLGYGSIGRQVGRVASAMGMEVLAFTASEKDTAEKKRDDGYVVPGTGDVEGSIPTEWYHGLDKESLHNFLKQDLDWLVVSVPLTDQTRHFLGTEEFKVLSQGGKRSAFVTNIARGSIVKQQDLIEALKDGTLSGAALDVADPEPLPKDNELWGLENVILTPHISSSSGAYTERTFDLLEKNLQRKAKGENLINVVNRKRGY
ncbi:hypothetical protein DOTSEDRAFT_24296 [Dothistroma septosporum NZE10]|uniref:D-isomer specific 2-hydroxyacid dehydrogenase NAD-binding domain-containing protein n=1 Tax=Dothistroma septosporum (strain NZE10 / CBS 128990) TaxID=675120 RepID=N1PP51_DOTSN|nr:hypothetical protein DOTSEDRAFT_24296 [Dothistroma septosporum NZE10]